MSDPDTPDNLRGDAATLARLRDGDEVAFDALVRTYVKPLIRHAARIIGSADQAQEVVQEVFFELWTMRAKVDPSWDIAAYLYWTTRNRALKVVRWEHTTSQREGRWVTEREHDVFGVPFAGESAIEAAEARKRVWSALTDVSPRCREIFMLVWDHQLPYKDIARRLGLAEPTVRSQVSRAVKRLTEVLGPRGNRAAGDPPEPQ